jgi:hypothetical protein
MQVVAGIVPFAVHMTNPALGPTENELDLGFMQARSVSPLCNHPSEDDPHFCSNGTCALNLFGLL